MGLVYDVTSSESSAQESDLIRAVFHKSSNSHARNKDWAWRGVSGITTYDGNTQIPTNTVLAVSVRGGRQWQQEGKTNQKSWSSLITEQSLEDEGGWGSREEDKSGLLRWRISERWPISRLLLGKIAQTYLA